MPRQRKDCGAVREAGGYSRLAERMYIDGSSIMPVSDQTARIGAGNCGLTLMPAPTGSPNWRASHASHFSALMRFMRCSIVAADGARGSSPFLAGGSILVMDSSMFSERQS